MKKGALFHFRNHFNFHAAAHGNLRHAKGAAGMGALVAKHLRHQFAGTVGNQMLLGKAAGGIDQRHQLDDAPNPVEIAHGGMECAQQVNGNGAGGLFAFFGLHGFAKLPDPGFAILAGHMAAQKNQLAGLHKRHIGSSRHGHGGQGDLEGGEFVVNAHGDLSRSEEE